MGRLARMSRSSYVMPSGYRSRAASRSCTWAGVENAASSRSRSECRLRSASGMAGISGEYSSKRRPGRRTTPAGLLRRMMPATVSPPPGQHEPSTPTAGKTHQAHDREQRADTDTPADPSGACERRDPRVSAPAGCTRGQTPQHPVLSMRSQSHRSLLRPAPCCVSLMILLLRF
jgi:hypothetical protein